MAQNCKGTCQLGPEPSHLETAARLLDCCCSWSGLSGFPLTLPHLSATMSGSPPSRPLFLNGRGHPEHKGQSPCFSACSSGEGLYCGCPGPRGGGGHAAQVDEPQADTSLWTIFQRSKMGSLPTLSPSLSLSLSRRPYRKARHALTHALRYLWRWSCNWERPTGRSGGLARKHTSHPS